MLIRRIEFDPVSNPSHLLSRETPSVWYCEPSSTLPDTPPLLGGFDPPDVVVSDHNDRGAAPPVGFACFSDAIVFDAAIVGSKDSIFISPVVNPAYVDYYLSSGRIPKRPFGFDDAYEISAPGTNVLLHHFQAPVYGHWLLESLPKLLMFRRHADAFGPFRIVLQAGCPRYVRSWIELLMPGAEISTYDERTEFLRCEKLIVPTLTSSLEYHFHPFLNGLVDSVPRVESVGQLVYLTREKPSTYRALVNADEICDIALSEGFRCFSPELLSIPEQVGLFAGASCVVGEFGSALHNTIFSPSTTKVLALNWINHCQSRVAQLRRQSVGYIIGEDGIATYEEDRFVRYRIDPEIFRRAAGELATEFVFGAGQP